jgi:hypothetical protein
VAVAALNAIEQMFFIPAYPFWSLAVIAMDVVALYGLCLYGSRENVEAANIYEGDRTSSYLSWGVLGRDGRARSGRGHP